MTITKTAGTSEWLNATLADIRGRKEASQIRTAGALDRLQLIPEAPALPAALYEDRISTATASAHLPDRAIQQVHNLRVTEILARLNGTPIQPEETKRYNVASVQVATLPHGPVSGADEPVLTPAG